jgi:stage II sporulation protein D
MQSLCRYYLLVLILVVWIGGQLNSPDRVHAAVPKLDQIRVALFIDTGKYKVTTPFVSLSSEKGMDVALKNGSAPKWIASGIAAAKFMPDSVLLVLLETEDAAQAQALIQQMNELDKPSGIIVRQKAGQPLYQVYTGPFSSKEAATAAKESLMKQPAVTKSVQSFAPYVAGGFHWNAGTYATEAEAVRQASAIAQAGFAADIAYIDTGGTIAYAALAGSEADPDALAALKQRIAGTLPNISLQPFDANAQYALKRTEITAGKTAGETISHYAFGGNAKLTVIPKEEGIQVAEKSSRAYRGSMEISQLNGQLAVINELPLEQYIYSVVGSEMGADWPKEALKAQAVAARTYALKQGVKYGVAHVSDSSADQVYKGMSSEAPAIIEAVNATKGEVLADAAGLITPFFFSNAGGMTGDPVEVWGKPIAYLKSVPSPDDGAEEGRPTWYRIVLPNGSDGYIRSDFSRDTGQKNAIGLPYYESTGTAVNVRSGPGTDFEPLFKVNIGDRFVVIDQAPESNAFSWIRGPYDANELLAKINSALGSPIAGKLESLEITGRGPSGRVTEIKVNGQALKVANPDSLRNVFGGLPSTRFEIEQTGRYTILGANGTAEIAPDRAKSLYALNKEQQPVALDSTRLFVLNGDNQVRPVGKDRQFTFKGKGNGHGLGMSQWGARGFAILGYDYKHILQTYYAGVNIVKE